jgi:hypothetical protein
MKKLILSFIIATLAFMVGCTKNSGSASVDEFLDSYEKIVVKYEEMASNGALTSGDLGVMMKAVNDMNMANLEISNKAEALKDQEWNDAQKMRQINLASRFSQAMMNMSNQTSNQERSVTPSKDSDTKKIVLQGLKTSELEYADVLIKAIELFTSKNTNEQEILKFNLQAIGLKSETALVVGEITRNHDHYTIKSPILDSGKNLIVELYAITDEDSARISKITPGNRINIKGVFNGINNFDSIKIDPAIVIDEISKEVKEAQEAPAKIAKELEALPKTEPSDIKPISSVMYKLFRDTTSIKQDPASRQMYSEVGWPESLYADRDALLMAINHNGIYGKVIEWNLTVSKIIKTESGYYVVTKDDVKVSTIINIRNTSNNTGVPVESLKEGDSITVKGYVGDVVIDNDMQFGEKVEKYLYLDPAIVLGILDRDTMRKQLISQIENLNSAKASNISQDGEIRYKQPSELCSHVGEIVDWSLPIETILIFPDHCKIETKRPEISFHASTGDSGYITKYVGATIYMYPKPGQDIKNFENEIGKLEKGKYLRFKGVIEGCDGLRCQINPAIYLSSGINEVLEKELLGVVKEPSSNIKIDDSQLKKLFDKRFVYDADQRKKIVSDYVGKVIEWEMDLGTNEDLIDKGYGQNLGVTSAVVSGNIGYWRDNKFEGFVVNSVVSLINYQQAKKWFAGSTYQRKKIKGRIKDIDTHNVWIEPAVFLDEHFGSLKSGGGENELVGIGAELKAAEDGATVIKGIVVGGPADKHGELKLNDRIVGVDSLNTGDVTDIMFMNSEKIVDLIRGKEDTQVRLKVEPAGGAPGETKFIVITRGKVEIKDDQANADIIDKKMNDSDSNGTSDNLNNNSENSSMNEAEQNPTKNDVESIKSEPTSQYKSNAVETYVCVITEKDRSNSSGVKLTDPVLILMQDRANVHKFGNPDIDSVDKFFADKTNLARIRSYVARGLFPEEVKKSILSGREDKFRVCVYKNSEQKYCVDVNFQNSIEGRKLLQNSVESNSGEAIKEIESIDIYEIIDSDSNIREGPGTDYQIIRKSLKGEAGEHQADKMGWKKLKFSDGSIGWVHEQNLKPKN